jgi:hypothetical protein
MAESNDLQKRQLVVSEELLQVKKQKLEMEKQKFELKKQKHQMWMVQNMSAEYLDDSE